MKATAGSELLQLVTFKLGDEEFAVDILKVQEVNRMVDITAVPNAPGSLEGVINLRGKVIPVYNLRKKLGLEARDADGQSRIMVVDTGATVGLMVDSVQEVLRLPSESVEPPPLLSSGNGDGSVKGIGKLEDRLVILLDLDRLLGSGAEGDAAASPSRTGRGSP
jgi:purine-binding chemotaxis protein CheW